MKVSGDATPCAATLKGRLFFMAANVTGAVAALAWLAVLS